MQNFSTFYLASFNYIPFNHDPKFMQFSSKNIYLYIWVFTPIPFKLFKKEGTIDLFDLLK